MIITDYIYILIIDKHILKLFILLFLDGRVVQIQSLYKYKMLQTEHLRHRTILHCRNLLELNQLQTKYKFNKIIYILYIWIMEGFFIIK